MNDEPYSMMMFHLKIVIFLIICSIAIGLPACTNDAAIDYIDTGQPDRVPVDEQNIIQGIIRIRLTAEAESRVSLSVDSDGIAQMGLEDFDRVARELGATKIERTFRHGGKFENRRRAAGLHLWYTIHYDESCIRTRSSNAFDGIEGMDMAEPVYKIEPFSYKAIHTEEIAGLGATQQAIHTYSPVSSFNDPYLNMQWHFQNNGSLGSNFMEGADINLFPAWEITTGSNNVIVAVMDGGIDYAHEDLAANMWVNDAELNGTVGVDDDNNGYTDDVYGWNFVDATSEIDVSDHGTHVAGIVGAVNNNGIGVCGVAGGNGSGNGVRLMSCQLTSSGQAHSTNNIADAFAYAADNGAVISQNSWGYALSVTSIPAADKAGIDYFLQFAGTDENGVQTGLLNGGIVIFAAGNYYIESLVYPAAYSEVVAVASMGPNFVRAGYSTHGSWVDLTAPGGNSTTLNSMVYSTLPNNRYGYMEGTSQACPHVSGIAALLAVQYGASHSGITGNDIRRLMENNSNDIYVYNPSYSRKLGHGYVDAFRALTESSDENDFPAAPSSVEFECYNKLIYLSAIIAKNNNGFIPNRYEVFYSSRDISGDDLNNRSSDVNVLTIYTDGAREGDILNCSLTDLQPDTKYYIGIRSRSMLGNNATTRFYETETKNVNPPKTVTDLTALWGTGTALVTWSVTSDADDIKADHYNLYYSTEDIRTQNWNDLATIHVETVSVSDHAIGSTVTVRLTGLSYNTIYYLAVQGSDVRTNVSDIAYAILYTGTKTAPVNIKSLPALSFALPGESTSLDLKNYFSNNDPLGLEYTMTSSPSGYLSYTVSGDRMTITALDILNGTGKYTITATDYSGLTVSASADFVSKSAVTIAMYPNPVSTVLTIALPYGANGVAGISIYNTSGVRVINRSMQIGAAATVTIDMSKFSSGIYTVAVKYDGKEDKRTITKL